MNHNSVLPSGVIYNSRMHTILNRLGDRIRTVLSEEYYFDDDVIDEFITSTQLVGHNIKLKDAATEWYKDCVMYMNLLVELSNGTNLECNDLDGLMELSEIMQGDDFI